MTLDELLALLPDNTSGEIGADDLRVIVADLFQASHIVWTQYLFEWTSDPPPQSSGMLTTSWAAGPQGLYLSKTAADGAAVPFRDWTNAVFRLESPDGAYRMSGLVTAPTLETGGAGGYYTVPVTVDGGLIIGPPPDGQLLNLFLGAGLGGMYLGGGGGA